MNHELVLLLKQIDWDVGGDGVGGGGGVRGVLLCGQRPAECADSEDGGDCGEGGEGGGDERDGEDGMVGRMLLKNSYKLSDEGVVA